MKAEQFLKFLLAGSTAALANFGSRIYLSHWMPYVPAIVIAYLIGMLTAFALNRAFVFRSADNPLHHQAWWFTLVNVAAVLQTAVISVVLARYVLPPLGIGHEETAAHAIGVAVPVVTSYLGHKHLTFKTSAKPRP